MKFVQALSSMVVAVGLAAAVPPAAQADPVDSWSGQLTAHDAGFPVAGSSPVHTVVSGSVHLDAQEQRFTGTIRLGGAASAQTEGLVTIAPGLSEGSRCVAAFDVTHTFGVERAGVTLSGDTLTIDATTPANSTANGLDCLAVDVYRPATPDDKTSNDLVQTDRMTGPMTAALLKPQLAVVGPTQLDVVAGATTVWVSVANTGPVDVEGVRVALRSKKVKVVRAGTAALIEKGRTVSVPVKVRVKGARGAVKVPVVVTGGGGATAKAAVRLTRVAKPAPVAAGTYKAKKGRVKITVEAKGKRRWISQVVARPTKTCANQRITFTEPIAVPATNELDVWTEGSGQGYFWDQRLAVKFTGRRASGTLVQDASLLLSCRTELPFSVRRVGR